jgi:hypothetical protein
MIIDHVNHIINVVSVALDEFTVTDRITTIPIGLSAVAESDDVYNMRVEAFPVAPTCNGFLSAFRDDAWSVIRRSVESVQTAVIPAPAHASSPIRDGEEQKEGAVQAQEASHAAGSSLIHPHMILHPRVVLIRSGIAERGTPFQKFICNSLAPEILINNRTTHEVLVHIGQNREDRYTNHMGIHDDSANDDRNTLELGDGHYPSLFPMRGGPVLLAARSVPYLASSQATIDASRQQILEGNYPVVLLGPMSDACRRVAGDYRLNALYIYPIEEPEDEQTLNRQELRSQLLAGICTNAATAMAGPLSTTLVAITSKDGSTTRYFYMDGIVPSFLRIDGRGAIRGQLQFGTEIQLDLDNDLLPHMLSFTPAPGYSTVTDIRTPLVLYRDHGAITIDRFKELIGALTFEEITAAADDIVRVIVQAQRLFGDEELQQHTAEMVKLLSARRSALLAEHSRSLFREIEAERNESGEDEEKESAISHPPGGMHSDAMISAEQRRLDRVKFIRSMKEKVSNIRKSFNEIVQVLGRAVSKQKQSSMRFSLAQMDKRQTIAGNVDYAKNMSFEQFEELLDTTCAESGILWLNLHTDEALRLLQDVAAGRMREVFAEEQVRPLIEQRHRDTNLDAMTASLLLQHSANVRQDPIRPQQQGAIVTSLPVSAMTVNGLRNSSWYFPLMDRFCKMWNPATVNWRVEADVREIAALRIISRSTLANASMAREHGLNITPQMPDVAWALVYIAMSAADTLVAQVNNIANIDFDDTRAVNMRCLLGWILTLLASGQNPISLAWQMFGNNQRPDLPRDHFEWGLYRKLIHYTQFSGWETESLKISVRGLICRQLNKLVLRAVEPLHRENAVKKRAAKEDHALYIQRLHDEYYPGYHDLVKYVMEIRRSGERPDPQRLMKFAELFNQFPNQRVKTGAIYMLTKNLRDNIKNPEFIDGLVADIEYRWNNYDRRVKNRLYKYARYVAKTIRDGSYSAEFKLEPDNVQSSATMTHAAAISSFRDRALGAARTAALQHATVESARQPIHNYQHIAALLNQIEVVSVGVDAAGIIDSEVAQSIRDAAELIYEGETDSARKMRPPYNPFPHLSGARPSVAAGGSSDEQKGEEQQLAVNVDPAAEYRLILGDHYDRDRNFVLLLTGSSSDVMSALVDAKAFNSTDEFMSFASFIGISGESERVANAVQRTIRFMLTNWNQSADEVEARAISLLTE